MADLDTQQAFRARALARVRAAAAKPGLIRGPEVGRKGKDPADEGPVAGKGPAGPGPAGAAAGAAARVRFRVCTSTTCVNDGAEAVLGDIEALCLAACSALSLAPGHLSSSRTECMHACGRGPNISTDGGNGKERMAGSSGHHPR